MFGLDKTDILNKRDPFKNMREFDRGIIGSVLSREKSPVQAGKEWMAERALHFHLRIGELTPCAQDYFSNHVARAISTGEKLSLAETANNMLSSFNQVISGEGDIPKEGPLIVVGNHWKDGPMHGMWEHFLISKALKDARGEEIRWIIQDELEMQFPTPLGPIRTHRGMPITSYIISLLSKSYDLSVVTAPFKIERAHVNGKRRDSFKLPVSAFRTLKKGGVCGFYPEARKSESLVPAWGRSVVLIKQLSLEFPETKVQPVGILSRDKELSLSFGKPFPIGHAFQTDVEPQDYLMHKIALLLPKRFRGHYGGSSSS